MPETNFLKKIALGTAQFGLDYGISNRSGQTSIAEVCEILKTASGLEIDTLDTAAAYGNSETILGEALKLNKANFKIITKVSGKEENLEETIFRSLEKLQIDSLYGCLFHDFNNYQERPLLLADLQELKAKKLISKIGFSLYYPEQAEMVLANKVVFDLVQVPYSLFDRRFETVLKKLKKAGVEIHTRSVFLQGLFFLEPEKLPSYFTGIKDKLVHLNQVSLTNKIPLNLLLLCFAALNPDIDKVVIGIESKDQLMWNAEFSKYILQVEKLYPELLKFNVTNEDLLLPFKWKI